MPGSVYRIDPEKDLPFAVEFMATPIGHHSPGLQRVLHRLRGEPLAGKYVLLVVKPHRQWQLARLSGVRGAPLTTLDCFYTDLLAAERDVFRRRWEELTGEPLGLPVTA